MNFKFKKNLANKNKNLELKIMKKILFILGFNIIISHSLCVLSFPRVHVFGDSHSHFCFSDNGGPCCPAKANYVFEYKNNIKVPFTINWIGPKTMYAVGRDGFNIIFKKESVFENDIVVFTLGEIDARVHIGKQRDKQRVDLNDILVPLVDNYINIINHNKAFYQNIYCVVMEVVPPTHTCNNSEFPYYGTSKDRINITRQLNKRLQVSCLQNNIMWLPIHDIFATPEGDLNMKLSDGCNHISMTYNYHIKQRLIDLLINNYPEIILF